MRETGRARVAPGACQNAAHRRASHSPSSSSTPLSQATPSSLTSPFLAARAGLTRPPLPCCLCRPQHRPTPQPSVASLAPYLPPARRPRASTASARALPNSSHVCQPNPLSEHQPPAYRARTGFPEPCAPHQHSPTLYPQHRPGSDPSPYSFPRTSPAHRPRTVDQPTVPTPAAFPRASMRFGMVYGDKRAPTMVQESVRDHFPKPVNGASACRAAHASHALRAPGGASQAGERRRGHRGRARRGCTLRRALGTPRGARPAPSARPSCLPVHGVPAA